MTFRTVVLRSHSPRQRTAVQISIISINKCHKWNAASVFLQKRQFFTTFFFLRCIIYKTVSVETRRGITFMTFIDICSILMNKKYYRPRICSISSFIFSNLQHKFPIFSNFSRAVMFSYI